MKKLLGFWSAPSAPIPGKYWAEVPTSIKIDDTWYVYFDKHTEKKYGAVKSKDLIHRVDFSDKIAFTDGVRHGTVIAVDEKVLDRLLDR